MITIGCDPEFVVLDEKYHLVTAENLPLDTIESFGADGAGEAFEIRPHYSTNTLDVVEHIKQIIVKVKEALPVLWEYHWVAGHFPKYGRKRHASVPCGGHIHIGGLSIEACQSQELIDPLNTVLISGLSNLVDQKEQIKKRMEWGYGGIGEYRVPYDSFGESRFYSRIEYRSPGSFLVSPVVSFLNLMLAKVVALTYTQQKTLYKAIARKSSMTILMEMIPIMKALKEKPDNEDIKLGITLLNQLVKKKAKVEWNKDFRKSWGVL